MTEQSPVFFEFILVPRASVSLRHVVGETQIATPGRERRMGYIGIGGPKGYGFSALLVINGVSILAILPPFWS